MRKLAPKKSLTTERQKELERVINECFDNYAQRGQHYYGLEGMSTSHVTLKAIGDFTTLKVFWPKELVRVDTWGNSTNYILTDDVMTRVQSSVRSCLDQLGEKGHIERLGNEHERRWRPARDPEPKTKVVFDAEGNKLTMKLVNGVWTLS